MPITYWTFILATLAIAGIFPFAGFFSKDEILFHSLVERPYGLLGHRHGGGLHHRLLHVPGGVHDLPRRIPGSTIPMWHPHESPPLMTVPLMTLAVGSVVGGLVGFPIIKGANVQGFPGPVNYAPGHHEAHYPAWFEITMMAFPWLVAVAGIYMAYKPVHGASPNCPRSHGENPGRVRPGL
jgi:NADH-quinone oxidoreductase subunit L